MDCSIGFIGLIVRFVWWRGPAIDVSVSIGLATSLPGEQYVDALLSRSDRALYRAKAAGRGCLVVDGS